MELGHIKVELDGALCRCGQRGCLEAYIADYALAREATTALNWVHKDGQPINVLLESLYDHAKAGNATAKSIFRRAGRYLALGLANVVNLFEADTLDMLTVFASQAALLLQQALQRQVGLSIRH